MRRRIPVKAKIKVGEIQLKRGFLFLPVRLHPIDKGGRIVKSVWEWRWLCTATWVEEYLFYPSFFFSVKKWTKVRWSR